MKSNQEGFTLIEMLIAVAITGVIAGVLVTAIYQFTTVSSHGTARLAALDEVQNAARWFIRDGQRAVLAGTPTGCTGNCTQVKLTIPDASGSIVLRYTDPVDPHIYGTISYEAGSFGTITYSTDGTDLFRSVQGSGTITVAHDVNVGFSRQVLSGTINGIHLLRDRRYVSMDITAPVANGLDVQDTYHVYLRSTGEGY